MSGSDLGFMGPIKKPTKEEKELLRIIGSHERITDIRGGWWEDVDKTSPFRSVNEYMKYGKSPNEKQQLTWFQDVAEAMVWIHSKRVVHGDISTSNMFLDKDDRVKLANFGGRYFPKDGSLPIEGKNWDAKRVPNFDMGVKSDIFDLGCVICTIIGRRNCYADVVFGMLQDVVNRQRQVRAEEQRNDPQGVIKKQLGEIELSLLEDMGQFEEIVLKCLGEQYGSASDVLHDLRRIDLLSSVQRAEQGAEEGS